MSENKKQSELFAQVSAQVKLRPSFGNWIAGKDSPAADGRTFDNVSPVNGQVYCTVARSGAADIDRADRRRHSGLSFQ